MSPRFALLGAALLVAAPALVTPAAAADSPTTVNARWQKHELRFDFSGFTSYYSCDGLESRVREILLHFGAREGAKVTATGCIPPDKPSPTAWVKMQFESLGDAGSDSGADIVAANWQPVVLRPKTPIEMGYGECEVVQQLKAVMAAGFALQDLEYKTSCFPHDVQRNDYSVKARVLKPLAAK